MSTLDVLNFLMTQGVAMQLLYNTTITLSTHHILRRALQRRRLKRGSLLKADILFKNSIKYIFFKTLSEKGKYYLHCLLLGLQ